MPQISLGQGIVIDNFLALRVHPISCKNVDITLQSMRRWDVRTDGELWTWVTDNFQVGC